jgi:hypothetical protein
MVEPTPLLQLLSNSGPEIRHGEPIVIGVPLCRGTLNHGQSLQLCRQDGTPVQCDVTVLDRWGDKSARWALLAFRADTSERGTDYIFRPVSDAISNKSQGDCPNIEVDSFDGGFQIRTGPATFEVAPGGRWPVRQVCTTADSSLLDGEYSGLQITLPDGSVPAHFVDKVTIESQGAVRAVVLASGAVDLRSRRRLDIEWRIEFFAGMPVAIVHNTIRNPHRARHPGGYWELGDPGSQFIRSATFKLIVPDPTRSTEAFCSPEPEKPFSPVGIPFELYQDSSGGENYRSHNHINRNEKIPITFRGYKTSNTEASAGLRATPVVSLQTARGALSLGVRYFWQNFPKSVEVSEKGIVLGLFPSQWNDLHELQGGEQKTHTFAISFASDGVSEVPLDWFRQPLLPSINPRWVAETEAIPYLTPADEDPHRTYIELVNSAIEGPGSFENKREIIDEYGWRNFGDIYADHEAVYAEEYQGRDPLVSHYNNQYDAVAGFCYQWLRSGDPRWWTQFNELAAHVVDIDIYHTDEDKPAYNHGLFWHTFHYVDAGLSTHRSYPRIGKSNGGGPSNEHIYTTGLMLHYLLTGNRASRDAAVCLAQFIIDIDDGTKTVFRWLARGDTGLASASRSPDYHGPGRGSANALNALIDAYRITSAPVFLEKSEQLIRRVCHPNQDIDSLSLLDAENRWFYTMFFQSLGKYLDYKLERGSLDEIYHYSRTTLLHFARWMAENEYPYLEKPEILEYPTETWPAQDIRKSEVFTIASLHAHATQRQSLLEKAGYFFNYAVNTLFHIESRSSCRPLVLLLSSGWTQAWFASHPGTSHFLPLEAPATWLPHKTFLPQRARFTRRARLALITAVLTLIVSITIGLLFAHQ